MPPAPCVNEKTHEYEKYYVCKNHLKNRRTVTENHIRTYGCCPCFISCGGHGEVEWNICVDKSGNGRCDGDDCHRFYLNFNQGYIDNEGYCFYLDQEPVLSQDNGQIRIPPALLSTKRRHPKTRKMKLYASSSPTDGS